MVSLTILGSGSKGNAALLATGRTRLLIDAGFSRRELLRRMQTAGCDATSLDAILITHEHSDHVGGLPKLAATVAAPVYLNPGTREALERQWSAAEANCLRQVELFASGHSFTIGDIEITSFTIPHDAADPVAFAFRAEGVRIVVVTDLGYLTENVKQQLAGADCVVLESNHDLEMLKNGGYPWALKQRVMGRLGHLSNDTVAAYLAGEFDCAAAHLVLAHLSENNNLPELALLSAERALAPRARRPQLHAAPQQESMTPLCF